MAKLVVSIDEKGRLVLPKEARSRAGIRTPGKLLVTIEPGAVKLIPIELIKENVRKIAREKLKDWKEDEHEATKLIKSLISN